MSHNINLSKNGQHRHADLAKNLFHLVPLVPLFRNGTKKSCEHISAAVCSMLNDRSDEVVFVGFGDLDVIDRADFRVKIFRHVVD